MNPLRHIVFAIACVTMTASGATAQEASTPAGVDVPVPVTAEAPASSVEQRLVFLLSGYEYFPTRSDLDAVASGERIASVLRGFVNDAAGRPSLRLRAVDALGFYDDAATEGLLSKLATERPKVDLPRRQLRTAGLMRHHAITAIARSKKAAAVPVLETVLADSDLQLTLTVVHALGKHCGKEGAVVLVRLKSETTEKVVQRELAKWVK